jgi:hypothetical protein
MGNSKKIMSQGGEWQFWGRNRPDKEFMDNRRGTRKEPEVHYLNPRNTYSGTYRVERRALSTVQPED